MIIGRYISVQQMKELCNNESPSSVSSLALAVLSQMLDGPLLGMLNVRPVWEGTELPSAAKSLFEVRLRWSEK